MKLNKHHKRLLVLGIVVLMGGFFWVVNPSEASYLPPCLFKSATGLNCPGCGSTRALYHLFHGELFSAFAMNPLLIIALPFIGWMLFNPPWTRKSWVPWTIMTLFLSYGILRNIPFQPFHQLAPGVMLEQHSHP